MGGEGSSFPLFIPVFAFVTNAHFSVIGMERALRSVRFFSCLTVVQHLLQQVRIHLKALPP